jgi:hypothetical protein
MMGSFDRNRLAQDKDVFRASMTLITNLAGAIKWENSWLAEKLLGSGEILLHGVSLMLRFCIRC